MSLSRDTSHDLKDVLNVIAMNVELLSRVATLGAGGPTELRRADRSTDVIRRELKRLDRSLDALLDRDMIDHEASEVFDVKAVCESILKMIAARAARQRVSVSTTMSEGAVEIRGFPDRIHAALLSLTVNALDAMPDGGTLHLSVNGTAGVRVSLCDSGPGISSDHVPDIWGLHFTTKARGTGLGLYVARSTVLAHGGTIRYLPHAGGGSCFVIDLPSTAH
jgi:two-component system sensor histidine kinase HydH